MGNIPQLSPIKTQKLLALPSAEKNMNSPQRRRERKETRKGNPGAD